MSSPEQAPEVELFDAFDAECDEKYIGPAPLWSADIVQSASQAKLRAARARHQQIIYQESLMQNSYEYDIILEPVPYTPGQPTGLGMMSPRRTTKRSHPQNALIQDSSNHHPQHASSSTTTSSSNSILNDSLLQKARISIPEPAHMNNPMEAILNLPPPLAHPTHTPKRFAARQINPVQYQQPTTSGLGLQPNGVYVPIPTVNQQLPPNLAPPRFRASRPQIVSQAPSAQFPTQAPPVRTAYEDFIRNVQRLIPGANVQALMDDIINKRSLSLNVPPGIDAAKTQEILQACLNQAQNATAQAIPIPEPGVHPSLLGSFSFANEGYYMNANNINNNVPPQFPPSGYPRMMRPGFDPHAPIIRPPPPPTEDDMANQDAEAGTHTDDGYQEAETYADYQPARLTIGRPHPDPVVETSSLSTVEPPKIDYQLQLPEKVIQNAYLSALQLESVIYACQQHRHFLPDGKTRRGFLIGDGAGVGKGRTIAGIIYENFLCGRTKSIWLSVSTDLKLDAERDLKDIGAKNIPVQLLGKFPYGKKISLAAGVVFTTYSGLVSKSSSRGGPLWSRLGQLQSWVGKDFDGVIVFDECHKAKNIMSKSKKPTKAAEFVVQIQEILPGARIVYASATGASETKHLGYMTRLGIWGKGTPYANFQDFCNAIERRGVGAMELVAIDLKMRGSYIARQLSFKTTSFEIKTADLTTSFISLYDECVDLWARALELFEDAAMLFEDKKRTRTLWACFWAAHQKFFKYLCIASKVPLVIEIAKEALEDGKCVVIGLQSTGEAKTVEALEDGDINEFVSTARATFESLVDNHFPAPYKPRRRPGSSNETSAATSERTATSNSDTEELTVSTPSSSSTSGSSSTTIDYESWRNEDYVKFCLEDGKLVPKFDPNKMSSQQRRSARLHKDELIEVPGSSNSRSRSTRKNPSPEPSKSSNQRKKTVLDSDSDSDVQITAIKPRRSYIVISDSDSDTDIADDDDDSREPIDPVKKHGPKLSRMRDQLYDMIDKLGPKLPNNTLDDLIDKLGGPEAVAEMTGRKGRVVKDSYGRISYKQRNEVDALDDMNVAEKERFMNGEKFVAIISEAASSGISLQADRRVANKRRRVHITIELPWSADRAIQQFGRTHRSNQISGPEYVFIISELAGEQRFASIVAKRLESLGALTHGDRKANMESRDLSQFNIASRICKQALELLSRFLEHKVDFAGIKPDYKGDFIRDARQAYIGAGLARVGARYGFTPEPHALQLNHFLNRLLGMKVKIQNAIFKLFTDYTERLIARKKVQGQYDSGILELNNESGKTRCDPPENFRLKTQVETITCTLHFVRVERGVSWSEAKNLLESHPVSDERNGFYIAVNPLTRAKQTYLLLREPESVDLFRYYKPNMGRGPKPEFYNLVTDKAKRASYTESQPIWNRIYELTDKFCIHQCLFNSCKRVEARIRCDIGLRHRNYCIMSGNVLIAWPYLERMAPEVTNKLQIVRLKLDANNRVIGPLIHQDHIDLVRRLLKAGEQDGKILTFD